MGKVAPRHPTLQGPVPSALTPLLQSLTSLAEMAAGAMSPRHSTHVQ